MSQWRREDTTALGSLLSASPSLNVYSSLLFQANYFDLPYSIVLLFVSKVVEELLEMRNGYFP